MKKTITVDTLDAKSIDKAFGALEKLAYNLNFKSASKIKLSDSNVAGYKILSQKHNINTLGDVSKFNILELKALKGIGPKTVSSLLIQLGVSGITLKTIPIAKAKQIIKAKAKQVAKTKAKPATKVKVKKTK